MAPQPPDADADADPSALSVEEPSMTFVGAVAKYGMAAVVAWLLFNLTGTMQRSLQNLEANQTKTAGLLEQHVEASHQIQLSLDRNERVQLVLVDLMRQQCMNAAHTYTERNACFTAGSTR